METPLNGVAAWDLLFEIKKVLSLHFIKNSIANITNAFLTKNNSAFGIAINSQVFFAAKFECLLMMQTK